MVVSFVKPFSPLLKDKTVNIYNTIFKIHTKYTSLLLLLFYCLVSGREFFGNPITCLLDDKDHKQYVETVCWVTGTFTIKDVPTIKGYPPVTQYQKYYQWIVVVLLLQAILFYVPAYLWKGWEHGRLKELCSTLGSAIIANDYQEKKKQLVDYLKADNSRLHTMYLTRYVICEILNLLIVLLNMWLLDAMFNQFWIRYYPIVSSLIKMDGNLFTTLADEIFPKLVKCTYFKVGQSGSEEWRDAKCVLSQNILNEKVFAFLYIWLVMLLVLSGINLIFRTMTLVSARLRLKMVRSVVMSSKRTTPLTNIQIIMRDENTGDWFLLYQIGRNLNPIVFKEVLDEVANSKLILNNDV